MPDAVAKFKLNQIGSSVAHWFVAFPINPHLNLLPFKLKISAREAGELVEDLDGAARFPATRGSMQLITFRK